MRCFVAAQRVEVVEQRGPQFIPMLLTLSGMVTLVRVVQVANALSPMLVTLLGIVTLVRRPQE